MAQGSIRWVCQACKADRTARKAAGEEVPAGAFARCRHTKAQYYLVVPLGGRRKWIQAGRDLRRAEVLLPETVTSLNQGTSVEPVRGLTGLFAEDWIKDYAATKETKTRETYTSYARAPLGPLLLPRAGLLPFGRSRGKGAFQTPYVAGGQRAF